MSEEYKDWLDKFEKGFFERRDDIDRARFSKLKSEIDRQKRIEHDSDYNMGRIAILETENGSVLMLTSRRIPPFSLRQLTAFGIDPAHFDVIIAKGVQAPIAGYAPVCRSILRVNTPGLTCADATQLEYRNRSKPLFPFEDW